MTTNLNHNDWVKQQFDKYLNKSYRDVVVHSSLLEGILVNESGMDTFDASNKFLLCSQKISSHEFCIFNAVRKARNALVHKPFKGKGLLQKEIDKLRNTLYENILEAYKSSSFLNEKVFLKYQITRQSKISYNPIN
jgi:hypothetical protein